MDKDLHTPPARIPRVGELDTLRALACGAVVLWHVLLHVSLQAPESSRAGWQAASQLFVLGGPVFFFLSALLCFHRHPEGEPTPGFWGRRLLLLGVPYLVWSVVYLLLDLRAYQGLTPLEVAQTAGFSLLYGVRHLAFVNALFQFYLLFPLLRWVWNRADRVAVGAGGMLIGIAWLEGVPRLLPGGLPPAAYSAHAGFLPAWLPYVVLGAWASRHMHLGKLAPRPVGLWAVSLALLSISGAALYARIGLFGSPGAYAGAARWEIVVLTVLWLPFLLRYAWRVQNSPAGSLTRAAAAQAPAVFFAHLLPLSLVAAVIPGQWHPAARLALLLPATVAGTGLLIQMFKRSPAALLAVGLLERPPRPQKAAPGAREGEEDDEDLECETYLRAGEG